MPAADLDQLAATEQPLASALPDPAHAAKNGVASAYAYLSMRSKLFPGEPQMRLIVAGRYTLLEKLGEGAMGVVFAAFDAQLGRTVALKVVRSHHDEAGRGRLLREAQSLARVNDPHVVQVHDAGMYRGEVYVAMERVEGASLERWIAARRPDALRLFDVLIAIGRGLAAAHAKGVVHRDVKPANVLVGADGRARVADFGLARVTAPGDSTRTGGALESSWMTTVPSARSESGAGTPKYMSPEQFNHEEPDARSDLFSYCVMVWEAVYGAHPFPAETGMELALRVCQGQIAGPPARPRGVPARLERILRKGLAVRREARYAGMTALLAELEALRRPRAGLRFALAGVVGATVALFGSWAADGSCRGLDRELAALWSTETRATLAGSLPAEVSTMVVGRIDAQVERLAAGLAEVCALHEDRALSEGAYHRAQLCFAGRRSMLAAMIEGLRAAPGKVGGLAPGELEAALGAPERCSELGYLAAEVDPPEAEDVEAVARIAAIRGEGQVALLRGEFVRAATVFADAVARARGVGHDPTTAAVSYDLGRTYLRLRRSADATRALQAAQDLADGARDPYTAADASLLLVNAAVAGHRFAAAERHVEEGRVRLRATRRERGGELGALELARVDLLIRQGRRESAEATFAAAASLLAADPQASGMWRYNVPRMAARLAELRGEPAVAATRTAEAREALARLTGSADHPLYLEEEGRALRQAGELEAAAVHLQRARARYAEAFGPDSVHVASVDVERAKISAARGEVAAAARLAAQAGAILERRPGEPMTLDERVAIAGILARDALERGAYAEALARDCAALEMLTAAAVPVHAVNEAQFAAGCAEILVLVEELRDVRQARARVDQALASLRRAGALAGPEDAQYVLRVAADVALAEGAVPEVLRLAAEVHGLLRLAPAQETEARILFIEAKALGPRDPTGRSLAERARDLERARGALDSVAEIEQWIASWSDRGPR